MNIYSKLIIALITLPSIFTLYPMQTRSSKKQNTAKNAARMAELIAQFTSTEPRESRLAPRPKPTLDTLIAVANNELTAEVSANFLSFASLGRMITNPDMPSKLGIRIDDITPLTHLPKPIADIAVGPFKKTQAESIFAPMQPVDEAQYHAIAKRKAETEMQNLAKRQRIEQIPEVSASTATLISEQAGLIQDEEEAVTNNPEQNNVAQQKTRKNPRTCAECSKSFKKKDHYDRHLRIHTNERPFICEKKGCDKAYKEKKELKRHALAKHTKERSFQCELCQKSFPQNRNLQSHIKLKHETNQNHYYPCEGCKKPLSSTLAVLEHMKTHKNCAHIIAAKGGLLAHINSKRIE
jgi:hypothetical protein